MKEDFPLTLVLQNRKPVANDVIGKQSVTVQGNFRRNEKKKKEDSF